MRLVNLQAFLHRSHASGLVEAFFACHCFLAFEPGLVSAQSLNQRNLSRVSKNAYDPRRTMLD